MYFTAPVTAVHEITQAFAVVPSTEHDTSEEGVDVPVPSEAEILK